MPGPRFATHDVTNQSPPFEDIDLFATDTVLREAVAREGAPGAMAGLAALGKRAGSARGLEIGRLANENPPKLRRHDQKGFLADRVEFHPAYHEAMAMSVAAGLHCSVWDHLGAPGTQPRAGAHAGRLAGLYVTTQMEAGHLCPLTMTNAAVATLRLQPDLAGPVLGKILSRTYDPAFKPIAEKAGVTIGMGMTEKQGGSDVRANQTTAAPAGAGGPGAEYILTGHKWFLSAPMCDAFLMLAQAPKGLSCFFVPRFLPDGTVNALRLQRLKDKLGNRSNASSEVELEDAHGWLIGEEGRGVAGIIEMVTLTRLDCAVASAAQMRLALAVALHHSRHRSVFGKRLAEQPLMMQVLADMALDVEAATALAFRLAGSFDRAASSEDEAAWRRLMTPVTKYWVCKMAPALGYEAMECQGGNGYVEEGLASRLYRELPLNAIWEGSGNVMGLDVLRVMAQDPASVERVLAMIEAMARGETRLETAIARVRELIADKSALEVNARALVELLALTSSGALLRAHAPSDVAETFIASRLAGGFRYTYGTGIGHGAARAILDRAFA